VSKRKLALLAAPALLAILAACGGPAGPAEETADLSLQLEAGLPATISEAYLVVHHEDGSADRWFDLKELAGGEQPLPHVAKYGYMTVLITTSQSGTLVRQAVSFPTEIFLSLDKGIRVDENGGIHLAFSSAANPWSYYTLSGTCPPDADGLTNHSFGTTYGRTLACSGGAITAGELPALLQSGGRLSSYVWSLVAGDDGLQPTDPPQYARVTDAVASGGYALAEVDWASGVEFWQLDLSGAPAGAELGARFAAWRDGAEVLGFHAFSSACTSPDALCARAVIPAERSGLESYRLYATLLLGGDFSLAWKPVGDAGGYAWSYGNELAVIYDSVTRQGSPTQISASGGSAAARTAAAVWSNETSERRNWRVYDYGAALSITFPALPDELARYEPAASGDAGFGLIGYDYDPLNTATLPAAGRVWAKARSASSTSLLDASFVPGTRSPGGDKINLTLR